MSNRSNACQTCKLRRIKCDEQDPACRQCTKSKRICIAANAASQASFTIHAENHYASGSAKRPRGPRSSFARLAGTIDLDTRALAYYLQYHLHVTTKGRNFAGGWSECISAWRVSGESTSMVDLAMVALALAVYSRTQREPAAATEGASKYAQLLQLVQKRIVQAELSSLNKSDIDSCLLTIFLMSRYEGSTHCPSRTNAKAPFELLQTWSHHDGAMAILKLWYNTWRQGGASIIVRQTRRGCIKSHLLRNIDLPSWMLEGHVFGEEGLSLGYDGILVRLAKFHHAANALEQQEQPWLPEIEKLDREGHDIDAALQEWVASFPPACFYQRISLTEAKDLPKKHIYSKTVYCYLDVADAALWSQYFATTMLLLNTCWRVLKLLRQDVAWKEQLLTRNRRLSDMADNLASSIPFCLERVKVKTSGATGNQIVMLNKEAIKPYSSGLVVWPLTLASSLEGIDEKQQRWFRSELVELGRITGDGGLECAEGEDWVKL